MAKKLYEDHLKELFGPNPTSLYVKYYNMWAIEINRGLAICEHKFGGHDKTSKGQNLFCYWTARLAATPKFVSNLRQASTAECKGNSRCASKLLRGAQAHADEIPLLKKEIAVAKKMMQQERSGMKVKSNVRKKSKQAKK